MWVVDGEMNIEYIQSLTIKLINHNNISDELINKIILIKGQHWKYPKEEQLKWISKNINSNDKHLMIFNNGNTLIGYMNMVNSTIEFENIAYNILGIGNVCVDSDYIGKSVGKLLMGVCSFYLDNTNKTGVLLCKNKLISFYNKSGWKQYDHKVVINKEIFSDNVFFSDNRFINASEIIIDEAF